MTTSEFSTEFDILYDNISSNAAPGIDKYEKSVYLTKAQLEIVKNYNGLINKYSKSFDGSDKRRIDLKELIKNYKSTSIITDANNINTNAKFFTIPTDVFLIKYEKGSFNDGCDRQLDIIPVTLDEFNVNIKNPFKRPNKKVAWRLDYSTIEEEPVVEIVSSENITEYHLRYLKYPDPIILTDLESDPDFEGMNLTIDGQTDEQTCKLDKEIHPEILDRAVELAVRDYKESNLQNRVELNNRNN